MRQRLNVRGWEFNIRQNGVIINSDMYGYPASHYSAPMESFEKIELVRGNGALQYGAQFGGMLNYVTKQADSTRPFSPESINTAGSYNLLSTYNAIGGTYKKFSYYAYYYKRHSDGYRKNSQSDAEAEFVQLSYRFNDKLLLKAEFGRSQYRYKIPRYHQIFYRVIYRYFLYGCPIHYRPGICRYAKQIYCG